MLENGEFSPHTLYQTVKLICLQQLNFRTEILSIKVKDWWHNCIFFRNYLWCNPGEECFLTELAAALLKIVFQAGFWDYAIQKSVKAELELLARMVQKCSDLISEKRLKMLELHNSQEQVRNWKFHVRSLPSPMSYSQLVLAKFKESSVEQTDPDVAISLEGFLSHDRRRRYDYLEYYLKRGMKVPAHCAGDSLTWRQRGQPALDLAHFLYRHIFSTAVLSANHWKH